jgi:hypothetical protein
LYSGKVIRRRVNQEINVGGRPAETMLDNRPAADDNILGASVIKQPAEEKQIIYSWDSRFRGRVSILIVHCSASSKLLKRHTPLGTNGQPCRRMLTILCIGSNVMTSTLGSPRRPTTFIGNRLSSCILCKVQGVGRVFEFYLSIQAERNGGQNASGQERDVHLSARKMGE